MNHLLAICLQDVFVCFLFDFPLLSGSNEMLSQTSRKSCANVKVRRTCSLTVSNLTEFTRRLFEARPLIEKIRYV